MIAECELKLPLYFRWEAGPKPIDGIWAPWWYKSVHKSTCFTPESVYPSVRESYRVNDPLCILNCLIWTFTYWLDLREY